MPDREQDTTIQHLVGALVLTDAWDRARCFEQGLLLATHRKMGLVVPCARRTRSHCSWPLGMPGARVLELLNSTVQPMFKDLMFMFF